MKLNQGSFNFPLIETDRLILRYLNNDDANDIYTIRSDESISEYLDRPLCTHIDEAKKFIIMINNGLKEKKWFYWGIKLKGGSNIIGTVCLWKISEDGRQAEVGFELQPPFQGKGIMQEALNRIIRLAFDTLRISTLRAEVAPGNSKSVNLLERNNFLRIAEISEDDSDEVKEGKTVMYELYKAV